jgi:hypothetical protein
VCDQSVIESIAQLPAEKEIARKAFLKWIRKHYPHELKDLQQKNQKQNESIQFMRQKLNIPRNAWNYEVDYLKFLQIALVYTDPISERDPIKFPIANLTNPLDGTFDLSTCGEVGKYVMISTGYHRQSARSASEGRVKVWIAPRGS